MHRARRCLVLVVLLLAPDLAPSIRAAPETSVRDRFVGAWNLVSWESRRNDGTTTLPFGGKAVGRIIYTADGYMSAQLMEAGRPPCTSASIFSCTPSQLEAAASGYLGYTGTFTVDADRGTVTHHVVVAFNPGRVGTDQVRHFEFVSENRLQLKAVTEDSTSVLVWERAAK